MGRLPTKISYSPNTVCYAQKRHVACVILSRRSVSCVILSLPPGYKLLFYMAEIMSNYALEPTAVGGGGMILDPWKTVRNIVGHMWLFSLSQQLTFEETERANPRSLSFKWGIFHKPAMLWLKLVKNTYRKSFMAGRFTLGLLTF